MAKVGTRGMSGQAIPLPEKAVMFCYEETPSPVEGNAWLELTGSSYIGNGGVPSGEAPGLAKMYFVGVKREHSRFKEVDFDTHRTCTVVRESLSNRIELTRVAEFQHAIIKHWEAVNLNLDTTGQTSASYLARMLVHGFDRAGRRFALPLSDSAPTLRSLRDALGRFPAVTPEATTFADEFHAYAPSAGYKDDEKSTIEDKRSIDIIKTTRITGEGKTPFGYDTLLREIRHKKVSGYGFRGETREPGEIKSARGFLPNATRDTPGWQLSIISKLLDYALELYDKNDRHAPTRSTYVIDRVESGKTTIVSVKDPAQLRALFLDAEQARIDEEHPGLGIPLHRHQFQPLNLPFFLRDQTSGGFISLSKSIGIAKNFASGVPTGEPAPGTTRTAMPGYVYACYFEGAFQIPPATPDGVPFDEQEVSMPGLVEWVDVVGWRKTDASGKFCGPIHLRSSTIASDLPAMHAIWLLLSGKSH